MNSVGVQTDPQLLQQPAQPENQSLESIAGCSRRCRRCGSWSGSTGGICPVFLCQHLCLCGCCRCCFGHFGGGSLWLPAFSKRNIPHSPCHPIVPKACLYRRNVKNVIQGPGANSARDVNSARVSPLLKHSGRQLFL